MAPHLLSSILLSLGAVDFKSKYLAYLWILHFLNSGINWIIYSATNPELRGAFRAIVPCLKVSVAPLQSQPNTVRSQRQTKFPDARQLDSVRRVQPQGDAAHVQEQANVADEQLQVNAAHVQQEVNVVHVQQGASVVHVQLL